MSQIQAQHAADLSNGPYSIHIRETISSRYIQGHFICPNTMRNFEEICALHNQGKIKQIRCTSLKIGCFHDEYYKAELIRYLTNSPLDQKENFPDWIKLLNGETITIKNNSISVKTTSMNFTHLESFITSILGMLSFPLHFMNCIADFSIEKDSISMENFKEIFQDSYAFDEFERTSHRYAFDIKFNYLIKLRKPVLPSKSLQKYSQSLRGASSINFAQIIRDILDNPGKIGFSKNDGKIYLKPQSLEEASEYFCKRYSRSHRLRLRDLLKISNPLYESLTKNGVIKIGRTKLRMEFSQFLSDSDFKYRFQKFHTAIGMVNTGIQELDQSGGTTSLRQALDYININNFGTFNEFSIDPELFTLHWKKHSNAVKKIFQCLSQAFDTAAKTIQETSLENHSQAEAIQLLKNKILSDPFLYSDDPDEIISDFANQLISGI